MRDCEFCNILKEGSERAEHDQRLWSTDAFEAFASIGSLVEGWVLIAPRRHVLSARDMSDDEMEAMLSFARECAKHLEEAYGPIALFEHGPSHEKSQAGCGVDHAHIHLAPVSWDLAKQGREATPFLLWKPAEGLSDVRRVRVCDDYLFVQNASGEAWIGSGASVPSQVFRRCIAASLGIENQYRWSEYPRLSTSLDTL